MSHHYCLDVAERINSKLHAILGVGNGGIGDGSEEYDGQKPRTRSILAI